MVYPLGVAIHRGVEHRWIVRGVGRRIEEPRPAVVQTPDDVPALEPQMETPVHEVADSHHRTDLKLVLEGEPG